MTLGQYIEKLRKAGQLEEIAVPVSPELEISEITDRMAKSPGGGKALLFRDTGTAFPVITNMFGSDRRMCMALGVDSLDHLDERLEALFRQASSPKPTLSDKIKMIPLLGQMTRWLPRTLRGRGACQEIVDRNPDLTKLPVLTCWKYDGGPFITLPAVHTKDPQTGIRNVGMYRMQVFSPTTTGMHWHRHKTGARHYGQYRKIGRHMPVMVTVGGDPVYTYSATAPLPDGIDEYLLAGFIRQKPVELVKCLTNDLEVPADCDFVIEGYLDPMEEKVIEGPFGDHTGFYSLEDRYPVFHVTCITRRKDAVWPATIVGIPPQEDFYIAKATERIFLSPIRFALQPEVIDFYMPPEGVAHNLAIVKIEKSYPGQAFKTAQALWGAGQMMFNKFMVIVSGDIDIRNREQLFRAISTVSFPGDILLSKGPLDILDHASDIAGFGGKICIDATEKLPEEIQSAPEISVHPAGNGPSKLFRSLNLDLLNEVAAEAVVYQGKKADYRTDLSQWLEDRPPLNLRFVIVLDDRQIPKDARQLLWLTMANCDPARDADVIGNTLVLDARVKAGIGSFSRPWPNPVTSDLETICKVDRKWPEYNIGPLLRSPSLDYLHLVIGKGADVPEPE